jgi:hypothetical protein
MTSNITYPSEVHLAVVRERDELRAKLEQHQAEFREQIQAEHAAYQELLAQANRTATVYEKEIDMLRAENERIGIDMRAWKQRAQTAEAEIERLQRQLTAEHETAVPAITGSEKEIERLRQELHRVAEGRRGQREQVARLRAAAQAVIDSINDDNEIDPDTIFRLGEALGRDK